MAEADDDNHPPAGAAPPGDVVAALIAEGDHLRAAELSVARGDLRRAVQIYDRLWRFADALPLAVQLGDTPLAVRLALDAGDHRRAVELADAMPAEPRGDLLLAARALGSRGRHWDAARLAERAGDRATAAASYRRASAFLDLGRLEEAAGHEHEAGLAYEEARARATSGGERAASELALGRLLARLGRAEDAARCFQHAAREPALRLAAGRALVGALNALGFAVAAAEAAGRLRHLDPDLPASLEEIGALDAADAATGASPVGLVPAEPRAWARRFKIKRVLGAGATSHVYQAEDTLLGQEVALKLLSVGLAAGHAERDAYARFAREAEAAGRLHHPNIVALHDADAAAGLFVWELLPGGSLADRLSARGRLSPAAARRLGLDLLSALAAAHDRGIVHRDVKAGNVLYDHAGNAKLGDFGAAHLVDFGQTQTGGLLGTLAYMSPEQISGGTLTPAADLYALGVTLFEALTGRRPFLGPDIVAQHLGEDPPRPSDVVPGLGTAYDAVLARALEKAPGDRWESAREMAEAVAGWPAGGDAATAWSSSRAPVSGDRPPSNAAGPMPLAPASSGAPDRAGEREGAEPDDSAPADDTELGSTADGRLVSRHDPRLGRPVIVEHRRDPAEGRALESLRALAALGGPHVQRLLALSEDARTVTYEALLGPRQPVASLSPELSARLTPLARAVAEARQEDPAAAPHLMAAVTDGGPVIEIVHLVEGRKSNASDRPAS